MRARERIRIGLRLGHWFGISLDYYEAQPLWRRRILEEEMYVFLKQREKNGAGDSGTRDQR